MHFPADLGTDGGFWVSRLCLCEEREGALEARQCGDFIDDPCASHPWYW